MHNKRKFFAVFTATLLLFGLFGIAPENASALTRVITSEGLSIDMRHRRSEEVYLLQMVLARYGYLTSSQLSGGEGFFGSQTLVALHGYQSSLVQGMRGVDVNRCVGMNLAFPVANGVLGNCERALINEYARSLGIVADLGAFPPPELLVTRVIEEGGNVILPQNGTYKIRPGNDAQITLEARNNDTLYPRFSYWQVSGAKGATLAVASFPIPGTSRLLLDTTQLSVTVNVSVPPANDPVRTVVFLMYGANGQPLSPPIHNTSIILERGSDAVLPTITADPAWVQLPSNGEEARTNLAWSNSGASASCRVTGTGPTGVVIASTQATVLGNGANENLAQVPLSLAGRYVFAVNCMHLNDLGQTNTQTEVTVAPAPASGDGTATGISNVHSTQAIANAVALAWNMTPASADSEASFVDYLVYRKNGSSGVLPASVGAQNCPNYASGSDYCVLHETNKSDRVITDTTVDAGWTYTYYVLRRTTGGVITPFSNTSATVVTVPTVSATPSITLSATPTTGTAPLTVAFNTVARNLPNCGFWSWLWGNDVSSQANSVSCPQAEMMATQDNLTEHVYTTPGTHVAQYTLANTQSNPVTITVTAPAAANTLTAPTTFTATRNANGEATFNWSEVAWSGANGPTGFRIYRTAQGTPPGTTMSQCTGPTHGGCYVDFGLVTTGKMPGLTQFGDNARYYIRTLRNSEVSPWSAPIPATLQSTATSAATTFTVTATNQDSGSSRGALTTINAASSLDGKGLVVLRAGSIDALPTTPPTTLPGFCSSSSTSLCRAYHLASISGNQTSVEFYSSGLLADTDYVHGAWLYTGSGSSVSYSNRVTGTVHTTGGSPSVTWADGATADRATIVRPGNINFAWTTANTPQNQNVSLQYRAVGANPYYTIVIKPKSDNLSEVSTFTSIEPTGPIEIRICLENTINCTVARTVTIAVASPSLTAPTTFTATRNASGQVTFGWSGAGGTPTGYEIYRVDQVFAANVPASNTSLCNNSRASTCFDQYGSNISNANKSFSVAMAIDSRFRIRSVRGTERSAWSASIPASSGDSVSQGANCATTYTGTHDVAGLHSGIGDKRFLCFDGEWYALEIATAPGTSGWWSQNWAWVNGRRQPNPIAACTQKGSWYLLPGNQTFQQGTVPANCGGTSLLPFSYELQLSPTSLTLTRPTSGAMTQNLQIRTTNAGEAVTITSRRVVNHLDQDIAGAGITGCTGTLTTSNCRITVTLPQNAPSPSKVLLGATSASGVVKTAQLAIVINESGVTQPVLSISAPTDAAIVDAPTPVFVSWSVTSGTAPANYALQYKPANLSTWTTVVVPGSARTYELQTSGTGALPTGTALNIRVCDELNRANCTGIRTVTINAAPSSNDTNLPTALYRWDNVLSNTFSDMAGNLDSAITGGTNGALSYSVWYNGAGSLLGADGTVHVLAGVSTASVYTKANSGCGFAWANGSLNASTPSGPKHLVWTRESNGLERLYINSSQVATVTRAGALPLSCYGAYFGAIRGWAAAGNGFAPTTNLNGKIGLRALYSRALSASEVSAIYQSEQATASGPLAVSDTAGQSSQLASILESMKSILNSLMRSF